MPPPRRKKWTEAEERTLIDKYAQLISDGTLSKLKTREKKFKPIASHVNSIHHLADPVAYPWEWTWKDVSNKVQNMRHQYSLVKQKIKRPEMGLSDDGFEFDWVEGLTHWSNFIRYKEVFGDVALPFGTELLFNDHRGTELLFNDHLGQVGQSSGGEYTNGVMGMEFDYGDRVYEEETMESEVKNNNNNNKRKVGKNVETKAWAFVTSQLAQLREMEARFEQREEERERERERRESVRVKNNEEMRKVVEKEWEAVESLREERRRRREEELVQERKREERSERRRAEWNSRVDEMLSAHRAEMVQFQSRVLDEQQNLMSQLLGMVSPSGIGDSNNNNNNNGVGGHYISQMMQNLQHVGGMVDADGQVEGHNQDDEFIVDG